MHQPVDEDDLAWIAERKKRIVEALHPDWRNLAADLRGIYESLSKTIRMVPLASNGKRSSFSISWHRLRLGRFVRDGCYDGGSVGSLDASRVV